MASRFWVGGTGTWDQTTTTHWSATSGGAGGVAVPTASDDVTFDANSGAGTVTISVSAPLRSLASAGSTITTLTQNSNIVLTFGTSTPAPSNAALDLTGFTSYTRGNATAGLTFNSSSTTQQTIKTGAFTVGVTTFSGGSWLLLSALNCVNQLIFNTATFDSGGFAITCTNFITQTSQFPVINLRTSTITDSAGSNALLLNGTPIILGSAATFVLSGASPGIQNGSLSNSTLEIGTINFTGTGTLSFTGSFPIRMTALIAGAGQTVSFKNGVTYYITSPAGWQVAGTGTGASLATIISGSAGTAFSLAIGPGIVNVNFLSIKDCHVVGGVTFFAGAGSTNVSGNSGITFRAKAHALSGGPVRGANGSPPLPNVKTFSANTATYGFPVPYIGASCNNQSFDISFPQRTQDNITAFEDSVRARTNGMMFFNNLFDSLPSPLASNPNRLLQAGKTPMLTLLAATSNGVYDIAGILAGTYDSLIQNWAGWMNGRCIVRFSHEMNAVNAWTHYTNAANYVAVWNYVRGVWQAKETALGLPHALWFWCPNFGSTFDAFYPGDSNVEIIGADGYSEQNLSWPSPATVYTPASFGLADLEALGAGTKPIIIGEIGCGGTHPNRAGWFTSLFSLLPSHPRVKGFNYWWHNNEIVFDHYQFTVAERDQNDDPLAASAFQAGLASWAAGVT